MVCHISGEILMHTSLMHDNLIHIKQSFFKKNWWWIPRIWLQLSLQLSGVAERKLKKDQFCKLDNSFPSWLRIFIKVFRFPFQGNDTQNSHYNWIRMLIQWPVLLYRIKNSFPGYILLMKQLRFFWRGREQCKAHSSTYRKLLFIHFSSNSHKFLL